MTTKHDDGGPAYPVNVINISDGHWEGRYEISKQLTGETLWDRYAAAVIHGLCSNDGMLERSIEAMCATAGVIADQMLAERRKRGIGT